MKKLSELEYRRPDVDGFIDCIKNYIDNLGKAETYADAKRLFMDYNSEKKKVMTMMTLAQIRSYIDMNDHFYEAEMEYYHSVSPKMELEAKNANEALLNSRFVADFEAEYGSFYITDLRNSLRLFDASILELQVQENLLVQKYSKAAAVCKTTFNGKEVNFYGLLKFMQDKDRSVRKAAFEAWANLYASIADELDSIYSELIEVRVQMAKTLGFKDYTEMAYLARGRYEYTREDVANFRNQVVGVIVPVCQKLYDMQKERLGIDKLHYYDEAMTDPNGNAIPKGNAAEMVEKAQKMYRELSKETGEFFDFMVEYELFDLESKQGKQQGGFCTSLAEYDAPFIFANFNGTSADVNVLTHEAGHAFEAFVASKNFNVMEQMWSTSEINEIHSMSMEFFTRPWMELFFEEQADQYRFTHLAGSLIMVPYVACVDEFQHRVYAEHAVDAEVRYAIWHELEQKYLPWRDYDGNAFLEKGGFWLQKQHIFMFPFYYIDYSLAQMGALEYYGRMKEDRGAAWEDYYRLCNAGGSKGYFDLLKVGNLHNPFADGTVKMVVDKVTPELFQNL